MNDHRVGERRMGQGEEERACGKEGKGHGEGDGVVAAVVAEVDAGLRAAANPARAENEKRYLKSDLTFFGVGVPETRRVVRAALRRQPALDRTGLTAVAEALWREPIHERRMAAVDALLFRVDRLEPADLRLIERLLRESKTWALVDPLAIHVAGSLVERHPALNATLDRWAVDPDFWLRRSALLALLEPLARQRGDWDRFARYADAMLDEPEFFIRKAIGWVLREVGKRRADLVAGWLLPRARRASGVTLREAVKYLPAEAREAILAARQNVPGTSVPGAGSRC